MIGQFPDQPTLVAVAAGGRVAGDPRRAARPTGSKSSMRLRSKLMTPPALASVVAMGLDPIAGRFTIVQSSGVSVPSSITYQDLAHTINMHNLLSFSLDLGQCDLLIRENCLL